MSTLNTAFDAFRQRITPEPPAPPQPSYADLVKEETAARPLITEQGQLDYENMVRRTFGVGAYAKQMDEMEQELERLRQQRLRFIGRFKPSDTGLFRVSGSELNDPNSLFFDDAGNVERGYMNYREFTNAANIYGNTTEFLGESTSTKFEKTKNATSNALLMSSNAGKSLSKYLSMDNVPEDKKKEIEDALASRSFFGKMFSGEWDWKDLPIVSSIASLQDNVDTNLLQWEDKTFEPSLLVDIIEQEDPEFAGFLKSSGVDFEQLRVSKNIFDFRYQINTAVQSNAIAKSMDNYNRTAGAWEKSAKFVGDQLWYSIDSPDFGGQILIAIGTVGTGNLIAGGSTIASRVGATSLTASKQAAKMATTINRIEKAGAALKKVKDYLPVNLGETLATKAFGPSFGKNKFVSWLAGPMVTEFFEEAAIDLVNQSINIHYTGTQLEYDWNQVLASGAMGGAMGPALSGLFRGGSTLASFPVRWVGQGGNWALNKGIVKIFNINPGRVKEFRAYAEAFYGKKYKDMTAEQKKTVLHSEIMAIAAEQELNNMTNNQFGRMEDPENAEFLTMVKALSKIDMANSDTNNTNTLDSVIAASQWLDNINARVVTDPKTGTTSLYIQPQVDTNPDIFVQDKETGRVSLTKEALKEFVIVSSLARTTDPTNAVELVTEFMKERIKRKIQKENIKTGMEPEAAMEAAETEIVNGSERVAKETEFIGKLNNVVAPLVTNDAPAKQTETAIESKVVKDIAMDADKQISETVNAIVAKSKEAKPKAKPVAAQAEPVAAPAAPTPTTTPTTASSVTSTATPQTDSKAIRSQNQAIPTFVANLIYAIENNLISPLEVGVILRKLISLKTEEQARAFLTWMMSHKNKEIRGLLVEVAVAEAITKDTKNSVKWFFEDLKTKRPDLVESVVSDSVGATSKTSSVAPQAESSVTPTATPTTERQAEPGAMNGFVGNLLFALEKGLISDVEVDFLLRKLARVETEEQASQFLKWMMSHKNKEIAKILELPMNESIFSAPKNSVKMIFSLLQKSKPELVKGIVPESETTSPSATPRVAQVAPKTTAPAAAIPATMDMARALETVQAHPELISLISKICK